MSATLKLRARIVAAVAAVAAIAAAAVWFAAPVGGAATIQGLPLRYAALGDSYSSGVGAGSYLSGSASCERSSKAYPYLWARAHSPASFAFVACSGAKTTDVRANQLGALSDSTTLVSITIGGNDLGFATVMEDCNLHGTTRCVDEINAAENVARTQLPGWLGTLYTEIRAHAPNAHVVVLGYPRFYDLSAWYCPGLSGTSRAKINEGADVLDSVIQAAAGGHGFSYADVRASFASGHEICDWDKWLHSVDLLDLDESYHPTAEGQTDGYLPAFSSAA